MKIVTFNLRCDNPRDGENQFVYRQPLILRVLNQEKPDVICFQEVLPHMARWLRNTLNEYDVIGCGRSKQLDGEQISIAFRKEEFQLIEMHTFWLSPTPEVPGSRYRDQSSCPRTCTEAVLATESGGHVLRIMNTHLDHVGVYARLQGLSQILEYAEHLSFFPDAPLILAGDFNAQPDSEEMRLMDRYPAYRCLTKGIGITYHGYMKAEAPEEIDYIWVRGAIRCTAVRKWEQMENGVFLSDHYPICAEIAWDEDFTGR